MKTRLWIALVLAVVALPLLVLGLIDPLEGGIALLAAVVVGAGVWLVSKIPPPRLAWIALLATVVSGGIVLGIAIAASQPGADTGSSELSPIEPWLWLLWVYRLGVLVTVAGWIQWIVRLVRAIRAPSR
jgi:hypothetical protein